MASEFVLMSPETLLTATYTSLRLALTLLKYPVSAIVIHVYYMKLKTNHITKAELVINKIPPYILLMDKYDHLIILYFHH